MRRVLLLVAVAAMVCVPAAGAWTWPSDGEVLQSFVFDAAHPYAAGEHRGIDVAGAPGADVRAPSAGTVTFAGSVPGTGEAVTILTGDGYAVTLTHLATLAVARGASLAEGAVVGRLADEPGAFVHLGVRVASRDQGYVDPASLLPARTGGQPPVAVAPPNPVRAPLPAPATDAAAAVSAPAPAAAVPMAEPAQAFVIRAPAAGVRPGGVQVVAASPARPVAAVRVVPPVVRVAQPAAEPAPRAARAVDDGGAVAAPRGYPSRHVSEEPRVHATARFAGARPAIPLAAVAVVALASLLAGALAVLALTGVRKAARIIGRRVDEQAQDPGGTGLAVRGWVQAPRPRRRVRAVRRVRALSPLERERRPGGERHGRARHARDGRG